MNHRDTKENDSKYMHMRKSALKRMIALSSAVVLTVGCYACGSRTNADNEQNGSHAESSVTKSRESFSSEQKMNENAPISSQAITVDISTANQEISSDNPSGTLVQTDSSEITSIEKNVANGTDNQDTQVSTIARPILGDEQFEVYIPLLKDKRVALFSNHTGIVGDGTSAYTDSTIPGFDLIPFGLDSDGNEIAYGQHILDALIEHGVNVTAIFSPEHGFRGTADAGAKVDESADKKTGVPILSLYNKDTHYPSKESMDSFDTLVVDMQDVGLRYYTYYISMYYLMDACAANGKEMIILDRPNPNGFYVDGPILKSEYRSGVGQLAIPIVYGMTWGELAQMINGEGWLEAGKNACDLKVIPCKNYSHKMKTTLIRRPSPNIRDMRAVYLYASTCFFENTYVSVGRGTDKPFEIYGSPYLTGDDNSFSFTPRSIDGANTPPFEGETCYGKNLQGTPIEDIWEEGINLDYLIDAYNDFTAANPDMDFFDNEPDGNKYWIDYLSGSDDLRKQIIAGKSAEQIKASWQNDINSFKQQRRPYLLYDE